MTCSNLRFRVGSEKRGSRAAHGNIPALRLRTVSVACDTTGQVTQVGDFPIRARASKPRPKFACPAGASLPFLPQVGTLETGRGRGFRNAVPANRSCGRARRERAIQESSGESKRVTSIASPILQVNWIREMKHNKRVLARTKEMAETQFGVPRSHQI